MSYSAPVVDEIRALSRRFVRELGFMGGDFAGTDLPPSFVHALIEIEAGHLTARDLSTMLRLEKSTVSRMLRKLIALGDVAEQADAEDGRIKRLSLTAAGKRRVDGIHTFARAQVIEALGHLQPGQDRRALEGLRLYTAALAGEQPAAAPVEIVAGYRTGLIGRITEMHASYYARTAGFGSRFESVVAGGLADFCQRLESPVNAVWTAVRENEILGSVAIDGEDIGGEIAHLRWFIVDDRVRGTGAGRKLLSAALDFVDGKGFTETHLWTFRGLSAARHLYETNGFVLCEERPGSQWGTEVMEQRFVRMRA